MRRGRSARPAEHRPVRRRPAGAGAARRRRARRILGALVAAAAAGCAGTSGPPDREPDVTGVVARAGEETGPVLAEPSDRYFEGMWLLRDDPAVVGADGAALEPADLDDGDRVEVWIDGACAESLPVQCGVVAIRVRP